MLETSVRDTPFVGYCKLQILGCKIPNGSSEAVFLPASSKSKSSGEGGRRRRSEKNLRSESAEALAESGVHDLDNHEK